MKYCPKCRYEYHELMTTCSTCGAELVPELPPPGSPERGLQKEGRPGVTGAVARIGQWVFQAVSRPLGASWQALQRAGRSKYVWAVVLAVTLINAARVVLNNLATSRWLDAQHGFISKFSDSFSLLWPGAMGFIRAPTVIESSGWMEGLWHGRGIHGSEGLEMQWGLWGVASLGILAVNVLLLTPWLVWLRESLTGTPSDGSTWRSSLARYGPPLFLWKLLLFAGYSLTNWLWMWLFPVSGPLLYHSWSFLSLLVVAATCLVPATMVVSGGPFLSCLGRGLRTGKERIASLLVLYGSYWLLGHIVQGLASLRRYLPAWGGISGGWEDWIPVGPLQWIWWILFGVIAWQMIYLWLSASFMGLVIEESDKA